MNNQKGRRHFIKYLTSLLAFGAGSVFSFGDPKKIRNGRDLLAVSRLDAKETDNAAYKMKKIAVEEHFVSESVLDYLDRRIKAGAVYNSELPYDVASHAQSLINEKRLKDMDDAGIDMQVISPVCFHECLVDPKDATNLAKLTNDELYKITQKHPKRYTGFAGLACQDPDAAAKELERAVTKLGLKGAMVYSHIQGEYLDARKFRCIFKMAERLGVPIYLHPKEPSPDMIKPYMTYPALAGKIWGYAAEAGLHAARLICSGLFDECPGLQMILGHGGEALPFWLWRMGMSSNPKGGFSPPGEKTERLAPQAGLSMSSAQKQPGDYVKNNFYVTTSGMFWKPVLEFLHAAMGADRVLFAVDYPSESNVLGVASIASMSISDKDKEKILHLNTEGLLGL